LARTIGTDVPFFLSGAETGFCTGRGDRVQALPDFPRGHAFVIVPAAEGLSTRDVYAASTPNPAFRAVEGELIRRMHTVRRIAVILGLVEAAVAWTRGLSLEMMFVGVLSVLAYLNLRRRIPNSIRRPVWVAVTAQAVAGLLVPAITVGIGIAVVVAGILLVILLLVMVGDMRRS